MLRLPPWLSVVFTGLFCSFSARVSAFTVKSVENVSGKHFKITISTESHQELNKLREKGLVLSNHLIGQRLEIDDPEGINTLGLLLKLLNITVSHGNYPATLPSGLWKNVYPLLETGLSSAFEDCVEREDTRSFYDADKLQRLTGILNSYNQKFNPNYHIELATFFHRQKEATKKAEQKLRETAEPPLKASLFKDHPETKAWYQKALTELGSLSDKEEYAARIHLLNSSARMHLGDPSVRPRKLPPELVIPRHTPNEEAPMRLWEYAEFEPYLDVIFSHTQSQTTRFYLEAHQRWSLANTPLTGEDWDLIRGHFFSENSLFIWFKDIFENALLRYIDFDREKAWEAGDDFVYMLMRFSDQLDFIQKKISSGTPPGHQQMILFYAFMENNWPFLKTKGKPLFPVYYLQSLDISLYTTKEECKEWLKTLRDLSRD